MSGFEIGSFELEGSHFQPRFSGQHLVLKGVGGQGSRFFSGGGLRVCLGRRVERAMLGVWDWATCLLAL